MRIRTIALALALTLAGCASSAYRVHPGAGGYVSGPNTPTQLFASQGYDTLSAADAAIMQTRADFLANAFPPSAMPAIKAAFNITVTAYDAAQSSWLAFNQEASTGASPAQEGLAAALAGLNNALSNLTAAKGVTP